MADIVWKQMAAIILRKISQPILIIGPFYHHIDKLLKLNSLSSQYEYIILNGGLSYPFCDFNSVLKGIKIINKLIETNKVIYNLGSYDLQLMSLLDIDPQIITWLTQKSNVIIAEFKKQTTFIITNGGITPTMNKESLLDNYETSFISNINGVPWHERYTGLYGYIISNNPLTHKPPVFYKYSAQIGNICSQDSLVYAQEVGPFGLKKTFLI